MTTVTGQIQDATGAALHATIDFISKSTPLAGSGVIITNTDTRILSNPSDGTFSAELAAGDYQVIIAAGGQSTTFNIAVPAGSSTATIDTLVSTPLVYPFVAPNTVWNGQWAGNITFLPIAPPPAPTSSEITYAGSGIDQGSNKYAYCVSYVTPTGETAVSPLLQVSYGGGSNNPDKATRVFLQPNPTGVTNVHLWRTYVDTGHAYDLTTFPASVGLLATVSPQAAYYDDWESTSQFAARVSGHRPALV